MRVLHWFPNYFHGGGVANAVTGLAHAQADQGEDVAIAGVLDDTPPLYGEQPTHPRVELLRWRPTTSVRAAGLTLRPPSTSARATIRAWNPDVVHVHAEFAPDNLWAGFLFDVPIALSFHGALHPEVFRKGKTVPKRLYVALARQTLYRRVARFVALCPAEAEHINRVLPGRVVDTIPLGPGRSVVDARREPRPPCGPVREPGGIRVVFVGRLDVYTKGLDLLVRAFGTARHRVGGRLESLTLVGPDWRGGRHALEAQVEAAGLRGAVKFVGGVSASEACRFLQEADLYVQLSRHDAFPLSVVDALVLGLPAVLSSSIGTTSYPEVARLPDVRVTAPESGAAAVAIEDLTAGFGALERARAHSPSSVDELFSWPRIAAAHTRAYRAAQA
jgi:glycosyltransferase involved in cell wall biosynthesis